MAQAADPDADAFLVERWIRTVNEWERVSEAFREVRFTAADLNRMLDEGARAAPTHDQPRHMEDWEAAWEPT